ncbi:MAG: hypothetical protein LBR44_01025 [Clostridiales Family XIII bacterium]|jgi:hypothetical protein|nr:hypothetical protein [Clostridiales Family XIII bacterium]
MKVKEKEFPLRKPWKDPDDWEYNDDPVEIEAYLEKPRSMPVNRAGDVFSQGRAQRFGGINDAPSVFQQSSIFQAQGVSEKDEGGEF